MSTTVSSGQKDKLVIYVLASLPDKESCAAIRKHLKAAIRKSAIPIELTDDFVVPPGTDVEQHQRQVLAADIVLSLLSVDFIDDDDLYRRSQEVIERYNRNETTIVPILVRVFDWKATPFSKLTVLPRNHHAVTNKRTWKGGEDEALTEVVKEIDEMITKMTTIVVVPFTPPAEAQADGVAPTVADDLDIGPPRDRGETSASDAPPEAPAIDAGARAIEPEESVARTAGWAPPRQPASAAAEDAPVAVCVSRDSADAIAVDWRRNYYWRTVRKRGLAIALDFLILFLPPLTLMLEFDLTSEDGWTLSDAVLAVVVFYLVAPALEASPWRATPGKLILRLQVTDEEGRRISFGRAFVRNVLRTLTLYSYVLILPAFYQYRRFQKTRELFHDEFSSTLIGDRT